MYCSFASIGHADIIIIIIIIIIMQYTSTYFDSNLLISRTVAGLSNFTFLLHSVFALIGVV